MRNGRYRRRPGRAAIVVIAVCALAVATSASGERASQPGSVQSGYLDAGYFRKKFDAEILDEWNDVWQQYVHQGLATIEGDSIRLTR